ncbi:MAG: 2,3-bisphosphoglycerate-independent phosphoglycerate mutase [Clostridia bacterium]|nr:2,3-bisphosphoglycerate-independent phosphoglycerate mutase [Clostridia bacterium]
MVENPVLLVIIDGFGINNTNKIEHNAVRSAHTPTLDKIFATCPYTELEASGESVGLPAGQMGNSEVGHMNIGAGQIIYQDLTYINLCIENKSFYENQTLCDMMNYVLDNNSKLHVMGLISDGRIHSDINHLYCILKLAKKYNIKNVCIHIWTDGRDVSVKSAEKYILNLQNFIENIGVGEIQTISGRYYAMDRNNNFDRTKLVFDTIYHAKNKTSNSILDIIKHNYNNNVTDEFIEPCAQENYTGVDTNDGIICFNYRSDRVRQITKLFLETGVKYLCMTEYNSEFPCDVIFKPRKINNILGEILSKNNLKQLRVAETEKYAHVTFFFNAGTEKPFNGEDRIIINSPNVKTYDLKPEMSADEITNTVINNIKLEKYDVIIVNYANPDMVGHTGNFDATVKSIEKVDSCIEKLIKYTQEYNITTVITSDHGNAEEMVSVYGEPMTSHTCNLVPFAVHNYNQALSLPETGKLKDISPIICKILGI